MAHSLVTYDDRHILIKDSVLDVLLDEIEACLKLTYGALEHQQALFEAYREWREIAETMPPGIKNIELDPWIEENTEIQFLEILDVLKNSSSNSYVRENSDRLIRLIRPDASSTKTEQ